MSVSFHYSTHSLTHTCTCTCAYRAMVSHGDHEDIPSRLSIHHSHHQPAESAGLTNGRLGRHNLSLLPRPSDYQLPPTPGNRLLSGRLPSRRNVLRPIEKPKTPALVPIDDGIRGYKLYASANQGSPPPTPYVRNTQLPPLELGGGVSSVGLSSALSVSGPSERSPPVVRGKMLSSRNVSAVSDLQESRRSQYHGRASGADLRPNTTTSTFRAESGKLGRKVSMGVCACTCTLVLVLILELRYAKIPDGKYIESLSMA